MKLKDLLTPFAAEDIEWRIQSSGVSNGRTWALVLAYITSRAIQDRLDEVCGPENWSIRFEDWQNGKGAKCTISIKTGDEWVPKEDGAENTDIEPIKGGFSGAVKRAGVHWGIGRYLYNLTSNFANIHEKGKYKAVAKNKANNTDVQFKWDPPELPDWALPEGTEKTIIVPEMPRTSRQVLERCKTIASQLKEADGSPLDFELDKKVFFEDEETEPFLSEAQLKRYVGDLLRRHNLQVKK
tara:strand:+ start:8888 stop:9607 length:720 start_codon:yes stop_codon:yes gene_type:complete